MATTGCDCPLPDPQVPCTACATDLTPAQLRYGVQPHRAGVALMPPSFDTHENRQVLNDNLANIACTLEYLCGLPTGGGGGAVSIVTPQVTGQVVATHNDGLGTLVNIHETVTVLELLGVTDPTIRYTAEDGAFDSIGLQGGTGITITRSGQAAIFDSSAGLSAVTNLIAGNRIATHDDGVSVVVDIDETITSLGVAATTDPIVTYTAEGGGTDTFQLIGGTNVTITSDGTLVTVDAAPGGGDTSVMTNTVPAGHLIGTHDDGTGTLVNIHETITSLTYDGIQEELTYTDEDGTDNVISIATTDDNFASASSTNPGAPVNHEFATQNFTVTNFGSGQFTSTGGAVITINNNVTLDGANVTLSSPTGAYIVGDGTAPTLPPAGSLLTDSILGYTAGGVVVSLPVPTAVEEVTRIAGIPVGAPTADNDLHVDSSSGALWYNDGAAWQPVPSGNTSIITNAIAGNRIATHDDGTGTTVDIDETITTWAVQTGGADPVLRYTQEDATTVDIQLVGGAGITVIEAANAVTITSGGTLVTTAISATIATTTAVQVVDAAGVTTQTLPAASAVPNNHRVSVKRNGAGNVLVDPDGFDTIDNLGAGAIYDFDAQLALSGDSREFVSDGVTRWYII